MTGSRNVDAWGLATVDQTQLAESGTPFEMMGRSRLDEPEDLGGTEVQCLLHTRGLGSSCSSWTSMKTTRLVAVTYFYCDWWDVVINPVGTYGV